MDTANAPHRLRRLPSWLLGQVSIEARRAVGDALAEDGTHRSQYALMASLAEFGPLSQTALSDRSGLDRSDVVRWIDDLADRGLVERTRDSDDRRRNVVSLTGRGNRRLADLDTRLEHAQRDLLAALEDGDRQRLVELLERVLGLGHGTA